MRYSKHIVIALAALLWLPASLHCQLASVPGLEFLDCQSGGDLSGTPDAPCPDSGCCPAASAQYKAEQHRQTISPPALLLLQAALLSDAANFLSDKVSGDVPNTAPPELINSWHFISRTALPPRAPSIAS